MAYLVGPKGQIVVAKELRERLGVKPGWIALQRLVGDHIEVRFVPPEHDATLKGSLARHIRAHVAPERWDAAREGAWQRASRRVTERVEEQ
jgi:bifunctional DNA-binding transcriptional regulator/antitoxin component of YhaV-PrlF toxin-antitoxin module